jgi:hypothetical protein
MQSVIQTLGETVASFDKDGLIPAFGFNDIQTTDHGVFPFNLVVIVYFNISSLILRHQLLLN